MRWAGPDGAPHLPKHAGRADVRSRRGRPRRHARIVVHHTADPRDQTWQQIDAFHRAAEPNGNGSPGIGYHVLIRQGRVHYVGDVVAAIDQTYGRELPILGHGAATMPGHGTACPGSMLAAVLPALRGGGTTDLDVAALQQAERAHVLPINPAASLVKAIDAAGMWPTSPETTFVHGGHTYHVQRGESPTGKVAAFYCRAGDWANVKRVNRAA